MKYLIATVIFLMSNQGIAQANLDIALPEMGDSAGALVSPVEEYQVGQSFYWSLQQSVTLVDDPEVNSYINSLGHRLVTNSDDPGRSFTFFVVPDNSVNAFAAPGGFIGIHTGLMLTSEAESELASVMAHEIAHVTQRHILRNFERSKRMSIPMTAAMIAAALLGVADPSAGSAAIMAVQAGNVQMQLDYSRAHEAEADNLGMQTLVNAGFDPNAMPRFFERLQIAGRFYGGDQIPEFLRTHPITVSRIADARGRAANLEPRPQIRDTKKFYLMREKVRVMTSANLRELIKTYEDKLKENTTEDQSVTRYGYALALLKNSNYTQARDEINDLIDLDDNQLSYHLVLADIEIALGRMDAALAIYNDFQRVYPDDWALSIKQVQALLRANEPRKAITILQRQLDVGESSADLYRLLAKAYGDMGQKSKSHVWLAEHYHSSGQLMQAADQLRIAADYARGDEFELAKISSRLRQVETDIAMMEEIR
ncbi:MULTISPECIES: M48 family metalloprotease [unclassified Methylophaga]|jgi:predicted Zn-dependent protease|uniref:beta-barrel assembly-enhancing protease n=1 Tax=unclassified Methylophaga TaxID=2629249 RepID=UPI0023B73B31|nr:MULTISPECIES: M48 family metalloprotease [unclassified Methylophaga]|tara:strand:+ start:1040 stop:2488 length:1449 start_codon:yes stop_codon:yes gene_type:complete